MRKYILVIDEGTTGTRALVFNMDFQVVSISYTEISLQTPFPDYVEQDFEEIFEKSIAMCRVAMKKAGLSAEDILCIGIANQRNTVALWDRETGMPIRKGIVWKDTRAKMLLEQVQDLPYMQKAYKRCGRPFVTTSGNVLLKWLMDNEPETKAAIEEGSVAYGTIDSWLVWKLTEGKTHAMSYSNASSLGLYDAVNDEWCEEYFLNANIPMSILPKLMAEDANFGVTTVFGSPIPITGVIGDQQASLFGQGCRQEGTAKCTNGTGTFMDINIGEEFAMPCPGLATMVAWRIGNRRKFLIEGMLPVTGSAIQWLRDGIGIIGHVKEAYDLAISVPDCGGVYFVVTLAGAFVPRYDPYARGALFGISHQTTKAHIARAAIEGIAFGLADIMNVVEQGSDVKIRQIKIDGGASENDLLAQSFADYIRCDVYRAEGTGEATAFGAAQVAAIGAGIVTLSDIPRILTYDRIFNPQMPEEMSRMRLEQYRRAVTRSAGWLKDER